MDDIDVVALVRDYMVSEGIEVSPEYELHEGHFLLSVDDGPIMDVPQGAHYFAIDNRPIFPIGDKVYVGARVDTQRQKLDQLAFTIVVWDIVNLADPDSLPNLINKCMQMTL